MSRLIRSKKLGRTGLTVSELGLGTYTLSGAIFSKGALWEGPVAYGKIDKCNAKNILNNALDNGINFIDTAPVYGQTETMVGEALVVSSDNIICETKVGEYLSSDFELLRDFSQHGVKESIKRSLENLKKQTLDIVLLHSPSKEEFNKDRPLNVLQSLKEQGIINNIGVSVNSGSSAVEDSIMYIERFNVDVLQVEFNLLRPDISKEVFPLAIEKNVGIVARVPFASGFLTGSIGKNHVFSKDDYRSCFSTENINQKIKNVSKFNMLIQDSGLSNIRELALRYILSFEAISTVIPGVSCLSELYENISYAECGKLSNSILEEITLIQSQFIR